MDVVRTAELIGAVVVLLVVVPIVWLMIRQRWLSRQGGTFECSMRLHTTTPSTGWVLGVARYSGEWLEWYRVFGLSLKPRVRLERARTTVVGQREPTSLESVVLYDGQRVAMLEQRKTDRAPIEVAMAPDALTGFLSWLESAPPGVGRYGNVAD